MRSGNGQRTRADQIARSAVHLKVLSRVGFDTAVILLVLRVSEEHGTDDAGAEGGVEFGECVGDYGCSLADSRGIS
jgi:hypothetical protein